MAGLEAAAALGFNPIKINCVVLKDLNDDELVDFARLTRDHPFQVRFIEFMPTVDEARWRRHFLPMAEIRRRLAGLGPLDAVTSPATAGPARTFRVPGFRGSWASSAPSATTTAPPATACASPRPVGCGRVSLPHRSWISRGRCARAPPTPPWPSSSGKPSA